MKKEPNMRLLQHLIVRKESYRPTWKLWAAVLVIIPLTFVLTRDIWIRSISRSLTCTKAVSPSGALLVENFDPEYLLFREATKLQRAGLAPRVLCRGEKRGRDTAQGSHKRSSVNQTP
jgi:hypothetical protein